MNILVVEDEKTLSELIELVLSEQGYIVNLAENADEAIKFMMEKDFDILIADMTLPDINGLNIIHWAKQKHPQKHYILMSGYEINDSQREIMKNMCCHFLSKPFRLAEISNLILDISESR